MTLHHHDRLHGSGIVAPAEGYAAGESPAPAPVQAKAVGSRHGSSADLRGPRSVGALLWSALKLASGLAVVVGASLSVQLRAHALPAPVILATVADTVRLQCDALISQVAPGQAGVLYHGDEVVGGGVVLAP